MRLLLILLLSTALSYGLDKESVQRGKQIYDTVCFACHGQDLEGATGHNLKDGEWIYGSKPEQILATLKKGFPEKGMVAFGALYKEEQLKDVVNFILSKQEGLRNLNYKIYEGVTSSTKIDQMKWDSLKPHKEGRIKPSFIDLNIPEVDQFGITYKGDLLIPKSGTYRLSGRMRQNSHIEILVNGKKLNFKIKRRSFKVNVDLKEGMNILQLRYVKIFKYSNLDLILETKDIKIPLSIDSFRKFKNVKHIVSAVKEPLVMRKRIAGLPSKTIAVAFPEKVNYAFNPVNGSINGLWYGEFLDIAPNINGRGNEASKQLGPDMFAGEDGIELLVDGKAPQVSFKKYTVYKSPEFHYTAGDVQVVVSAIPQSGSLAVRYKLSGAEDKNISLKIPSGIKVNSSSGAVENGILKIKSSDNAGFSLVIIKEGTSK